MTIENSERIKELETKSIFQEDAIERLSKEVRLQQIEIIKLKDDVDQLMLDTHLAMMDGIQALDEANRAARSSV